MESIAGSGRGDWLERPALLAVQSTVIQRLSRCQTPHLHIPEERILGVVLLQDKAMIWTLCQSRHLGLHG